MNSRDFMYPGTALERRSGTTRITRRTNVAILQIRELQVKSTSKKSSS